ncbi:MAG TPA: nitroreductase [Gemmatimonadaceae bacterium]|nr:nitroreductase [Gemmatimonadaceae bacterium]
MTGPLAVLDAIRGRRSIRRFSGRAVAREEIETLLEAAAHAPNHRLTQPWRFYVLGERARRRFGEALGARKARKVEDPGAAQAVLEKVAAEHAALPAMLAFSMVVPEGAEQREEDYAATLIAAQNLCLAAMALGLGTHIKTGAIMDDPAARAAVGVPEGERIVATIVLGEPAEVPPPKPRAGAASFTTWVE